MQAVTPRTSTSLATRRPIRVLPLAPFVPHGNSETRPLPAMPAYLAGLMALVLLGVSPSATARPNCNVPKPPPICERGDPPPPPKPQPTPPPPMSLQRPGITGGGYFLDTEFNVYVRPQTADKSKVTRMAIEKGSTDNGPWSAWVDRPVAPSGSGNIGPQYPFYLASLKYVDVLPRTCFRARFFTATGGYSPWSAAKCAASAPAATQVGTLVGTGSVTVSWIDNSIYDQYYYVETTDPDGSNLQLQTVAGNGSATGWRRVTLARPYRQQDVCARVWAAERLPGLSQYLQDSDFSDSTPMNSAINRGAPVCFEPHGI